ncbi:MAG: ImmA/IrrE family metallo-endopeptidase [Dehalococcoidia bacterium]|nr:ImmA/IrrE family metallo-endopeptidase [Dehalococcoidia bacterium]
MYKIRTLTAEPPEVFGPKIREMFADAGVALAFVAELPETHLSGATRWVTKGKALIVLSLRHKTDDHFWFSLFHEAGHILFDGKKLIFLDEINTWTDAEEVRVNEFASNILIPRQTYANFMEKRIFTHTSVRNFSQQLGIAPGIIVGRLQHEGVISWGLLNSLKRKFDLVETCD